MPAFLQRKVGFPMNRDAIKMIAMFTMLLNHIANAFLPAGQPLTNAFLYIGYFTAVTMCYFLVEGYGYTRSKGKYAGRLLGFAVLAQLPYQLAFPEYGIAGFVQFNMLFTLLLCFLVLYVQEKVHDRVLQGACIVLLVCASLFLRLGAACPRVHAAVLVGEGFPHAQAGRVSDCRRAVRRHGVDGQRPLVGRPRLRRAHPCFWVHDPLPL